MTRKELTNELRKLGFKDMCLDDNKTLVAYDHVQSLLKVSRTPIKAVTSVYLEKGILRVVINDYDDLETDYCLDFEY